MSMIYGFEREPYRTELEVQVLDVEERSGEWIASLDDTILYPEGGGQPSDRGWLDEVEVRHVGKTSAGLEHVLAAPVGRGAARLRLDWSRRYDHMQQHTAQHLLTRIALDRHDWSTRSFHIGPEVSDIELDCPPPRSSEIEALEDAVAEIIVQARPIHGFRVSAVEFQALEVRSRGLPAGHHGEIRLVQIEDFDLNTCGGTHLASTAEVEALKIVGSESLRGGCRLHWVAGKRLRRRLAAREQLMAELRRRLDTADSEIPQILDSRLEDLRRARQAQRWLEHRLAELMAQQLSSSREGLIELHLEGFEAPLLRPIAEALAKQADLAAALLTAQADSGSLFALVIGERSSVDLAAAGGAVAEVLGGRGGGAGRIFQGKAADLERRSEAVRLLEQLLV